MPARASFSLKAEEQERLNAVERACRCRLMEARESAHGEVSQSVKRAYTKIADEWTKLADEIERSAGSSS